MIEKELTGVVEEICDRERYNIHIKNCCKRYFNCCDNEEDEMNNKIRAVGLRKIMHDMDINRIFSKIRNYEKL
jgi:hypothetical protein